MEDEDKGVAEEGDGGGRAAQSGRQPIIEKKKTWSELKQACLLVPFLCFEGKELIALSNFEIAEEYSPHRISADFLALALIFLAIDGHCSAI